MEDLVAKLGAWSVLLLVGWWIVSAYVLNKVNEFFENRKFEKEKKFHHIKVPFYKSRWANLENSIGGLSFMSWVALIFVTGPLSVHIAFFEAIRYLHFTFSLITLFIWISIALLDNYEVKQYIKRYREENLKND